LHEPQAKGDLSGKVVNKAHTINTGVDEFPHYVLEYLIDNYCSEETFDQDVVNAEATIILDPNYELDRACRTPAQIEQKMGSDSGML
jgi:predicted ATP-dependent Lon-type protease